MSDRIKKIKIKQTDGTFSDYIPIGANAKDIDLQYNDSNVENTLKKKPYYYDNVATMKLDDTLREGDMAITLGYYEANDGGGATYLIKSGETVDNYFVYSITSGLYASLLIDKNFNIHQIGAHGDNTQDDSVYLNKAIENTKITYINLLNKEYKFSNTIELNKCVNIDFNNASIYYDGTDFLFNVLTRWDSKPILSNFKAVGSTTNNFLKINDGAWGNSVKLINFKVYKFSTVIDDFASFNSEYENGLFATDGTFNFDGNSNNITNACSFKNVYFKCYDGNPELYPQYRFIANYTRNMRFESCSFEQFITFFKLTNCGAIQVDNCGIEQCTNFYNGGGIIIGNSNYFYGLEKINENDTLMNIPLTPITGYSAVTTESSVLRLRQILRDNPIQSHSAYVEDVNENSIPLWNITSGGISNYIPYNTIIEKDKNVSELSCSISNIMREQNDESYLFNFTIIAFGTDASYKVFQHDYLFRNKASIINLQQKELRDGTWENADLKDVTFTDTLDNFIFKTSASKTISSLFIVCEYKILGNQLT